MLEAHVLYYTYIQKLSFLDCFTPKQSLNGLKALFYDAFGYLQG